MEKKYYSVFLFKKMLTYKNCMLCNMLTYIVEKISVFYRALHNPYL